MAKRKAPALVTASAEVKVPFHDVDIMDVAWHGHYVKYFEIARCALLDKLAYNYREMRDSGYAWPVIDLAVRYPAPAKFAECLTVSAALVEWENRLRIEYAVHNAQGLRTTYGHTVQVAVAIATGEMQFVSPPVLAEKLAPWLPPATSQGQPQ
ncbi:acyl-CoA thioesterase [Simiduia sp. 21SJ11W-1]|uniref:acyl-CoA thioesterase n=1 Tax=Simiduia sp. 21SJ11W-1 TaxID=2909669 RepID=UPI00209E7E5E|nr:thioesterase family protein [Simiduia sp. 21SJ11W-1]UTA48723.1 acyl-CoA thioesterase [Simiduia sp. 21SJ11W-1]